jgi:hypothetical protein
MTLSSDGRPDGPPAGPAGPRLEFLLAVLLAVVTLSGFVHVLGCGFVDFDDLPYVVNNAAVRSGLTTRGVVWAFTDTHVGLWMPLTWLSHMLDAQLYGLAPAGHHLTNLLLHAGNVVLLFLVLARMTGALWCSAVVAALFALHPLRVESVAWVAERKDVLSTFFLLLALRAYVAYAAGPTVRRYALVFVCFALGLMAKPMLVTLPLLVLLLDYWPLGRVLVPGAGRERTGQWPVRRLVMEKLPLAALAAVGSAVAVYAAGQGGAMRSIEPLSHRAANAAVACVRYLAKIAWPARLAVFYPFPPAWPVWQVAGATLIVVVVSVLAVTVRRRCPYVMVGWFWFVGGLFPVIGLVQAGDQAMADRFTYVPMIGLLMAITWGLHDLVGRSPASRTGLVAASMPILIVLGALTQRQVGYWRDSVTLFGHAAEVTENNWLAQKNLGNALLEARRPQEAMAHFREALRVQPNFADAEFGIGLALATEGKPDEGAEHYRRCLEIAPTFVGAHNNLGALLLARGDVAGATEHFAAAVRLQPDDVGLRGNLRAALAMRGPPPDSADHAPGLLDPAAPPDAAGARP